MGPLPRTLELFYDVLSPYSWLGFEVTPGARPAGAWGRGRREGRERGAEKFLALPDGPQDARCKARGEGYFVCLNAIRSLAPGPAVSS